MTQNRIEESFLVLTKPDGKRCLINANSIERVHETAIGASVVEVSGGVEVSESFDSIVKAIKAAGHVVKVPV